MIESSVAMLSTMQFRSKLAYFALLLFPYLFTIISTAPTSTNSFETENDKISITNGDGPLEAPPLNVSATFPPAGFSIEASYGTVEMNSKGCFFATFIGLSNLAAASYNSWISGSLIIDPPAFPDVTLSVSGLSTEAGFNSKYGIWGLTLAIKYMVDRNEFRNWRFTLRAPNAILGTVWFFYRSPREGIEANGTSIESSLRNADLATAALITNEENANPTFSVRDVQGPVLNFNAVMMVIVGGLTDIAPYEMSQPLSHHFRTAFPPYRLRFDLWPGTPSTVFTYEIVRQTFAGLVMWYMTRPICKPAQITLLVDGSVYGVGNLIIGNPFLSQAGRGGTSEGNSTTSE